MMESSDCIVNVVCDRFTLIFSDTSCRIYSQPKESKYTAALLSIYKET